MRRRVKRKTPKNPRGLQVDGSSSRDHARDAGDGWTLCLCWLCLGEGSVAQPLVKEFFGKPLHAQCWSAVRCRKGCLKGNDEALMQDPRRLGTVFPIIMEFGGSFGKLGPSSSPLGF